MKNKYLLKVLAAPLSIGSLLLVGISFCVKEPWRGLSINLAAGLLGSMVTVFYIETVIKRNEKNKWTKVHKHVGRQVNFLANATTSSVRGALGLEFPPLSAEEMKAMSDPRYMRTTIIRLIESQLLPQLSRIAAIDQGQWRILATNLQGAMTEADRIISLFSNSLDSRVMELILDIREKARAVLLNYQTWPDLLGIPFDKLPLNNRGESSIPLMRATHGIITAEAEMLLKCCAELLREIDASARLSEP